MIKNKLRENEKGVTGIGTMSIFISFIIVASLASGTIIYSGSIIVNDAEVTYSQALEEITTGLDIISMKGDRGRDAFSTKPNDPDTPNIGNGVLESISTKNNATKSETWRITCIQEINSGGIFSVNGTVSGIQNNYNISIGNYSSDGGEISFVIIPGDIDFIIGDDFQFNTTSTKLYNSLQELQITIELRIGSPNINMTQTLIEVMDENDSFLLTYSNNVSEQNSYSALVLRDPNGEWETGKIVGDGTLIKIIIDCTKIGLDLTNNNDLIIILMPKNGIPTYEITIIPSAYGGRYIELY